MRTHVCRYIAYNEREKVIRGYANDDSIKLMTVRGYNSRVPSFHGDIPAHYRCKIDQGSLCIIRDAGRRRGPLLNPSRRSRHPPSWDRAPVSRRFRAIALAGQGSPWETASNFNRRNPRSLCTIARLRPAILRRSYDDLATRHDKSKPTDYENRGDFQMRSIDIDFRERFQYCVHLKMIYNKIFNLLKS